MNVETSAVIEIPPTTSFGRTRPRADGFGSSFWRVYRLWLASWEAELGAITIASQTGTLSTNDAAAHKATISVERELVTKQFTLLLGHQVVQRP